ncbi:AMP-binding protein [Amycolatopsis acidiphila]|uniref:Cyclohexanecarboxylate-CoA ligase n=1 Tax=Amycolatopsis acidiphila TaxID=715473 RepID=A0A558AB20_9PSEU|nr:AMP-binding protein [Amycolatopsis acidiphila]TVT21452.1 cyclohexanecarboxylate-CoA ligase [Amycolatopsis acidiphila]UIJ63129.1 AMP-binding protein [Amycolatopsis acidiphila]GHG73895.1 long-chain-fatty-acid--CoA ligase [Amycolatopsis acidiphila]
MTVEQESDRAGLVRSYLEQGFYARRTFAEELTRGAELFEQVPVTFTGSGATVTVGELYRRAVRAAGALQRLGVLPGDVVAVQVPNWAEGVVATEAVLLAGAVLVPVVHIYGPREVGFILRESGARMMIMPDRWRTTDYLARLPELLAVPTLEHVVVVGEPAPEPAISWRSLEESAAAWEPVEQDPDDVCLLIYTSGTTADPKGVQHTHETILFEIRTQPRLIGPGDDEVKLGCFPAGHIAGLLNVMRSLVLGTPAVLLDAWDAKLAAAMIEEHRVTITSGSPYHLATLLDAAEETGASLATLREFMVGAATVPEELVARAEAAGVVTYRCYGSTEQPTISSGTVRDPLWPRQHTDGRPAPGTEVRIVGPDDEDLPTGVDGEVLSRGPELFAGYRNPELDAVTFAPGGWLRTGDIGRLDEHGYLTITDRIKDVIIRGGETISSREVEDVLLAHPAVADAAAVAAPDPRYGDRVCAYVIPRPGHTLDLAAVREHFRAAGIARQKTPERLELVGELPRTALGKVRKADLRARLRDGEGDAPA